MLFLLLYTVLPSQPPTRQRDENVKEHNNPHSSSNGQLHILPPEHRIVKRNTSKAILPHGTLQVPAGGSECDRIGRKVLSLVNQKIKFLPSLHYHIYVGHHDVLHLLLQAVDPVWLLLSVCSLHLIGNDQAIGIG